jgi:hypothetical protein
MWTGLIARTTRPISLNQPLVTRLIHSLAKAEQKPIIPFHLARSSFSVRLKPTTAIFNLPKKPFIIRRSSNISSEQTHLIAIWPGQNASYLPTNCRLHGTHAQRRVLQLSAGSAPLPSRNVRAQTKKEKTPDDKPMHDAAIRNRKVTGHDLGPAHLPAAYRVYVFTTFFWNGPRVGGMKKFAALPSTAESFRRRGALEQTPP